MLGRGQLHARERGQLLERERGHAATCVLS